MTDKIIEILNKYQSSPPLHNEGTIDPMDFYKVAAELEPLINQEVERRISEILPTKNEIGNAAQLFDKQKRPLWKEAIWRAGANWAIDIMQLRLIESNNQ